jgi:hypothetical protein
MEIALIVATVAWLIVGANLVLTYNRDTAAEAQ